jgi:polyisoprenoid-binding protein YceI
MRLSLLPLIVLLALAPGAAALAASNNVGDLPSGTYVIDKKHGSVTAKVMHMGVSLYMVRFNSFEGSFTYDKAHPEASKVQASVDTGSLDVNADYGAKFAEEFLDAPKSPKMTFVSTAITPGPGNTGTMSGNLTLRGVTKPVTFNVTFNGVGKNPLPPFRTITGFTAVTTIKRSDFGSDFLNNGIVGDDVAITIETEFDKQ